MRKKILFRASFVCFQSIVEDYLEVGGLVGGRCGSSVSVGHNGENEEYVHAERRTAGSRLVGMGDTASRIRKYVVPQSRYG